MAPKNEISNKVIHDCYVELKDFTQKTIDQLEDILSLNGILIDHDKKKIRELIGEWEEYKQEGE